VSSPRFRRYAGLLGAIVLVALAVNGVFVSPPNPTGIPPGQRLPPFAAPLAQGNLDGEADTATHADDGEAGRVPACAERGAGILNVCELYERGPVVLALFIDAGSCASVLASMQALSHEFPAVRFAAVAIRGERRQLRALMRRQRLTLPIGLDAEGRLATLYKVLTCPQVNFAYRGGVVQGKALLGSVSPASLRARVRELVAASRARERRAAT
jgi:AhpC/TSA family